jgi:cell division septation protein DedD
MSGYATPAGGTGVRNLDEIQEDDPSAPRSSKVSAMVLASFGGAAIVFAALFLMRGSEEAAKPHAADPLGDLMARAPAEEAKDNGKLRSEDVTFPSVLTDQADHTTAMEVVRGQRDAQRAGERGPIEGELPRADMPFDGPPPATDRLPVVPLPAQDMMNGAPPPRAVESDKLRGAATELSREDDSQKPVEPGSPGGYQLQVSSFKTEGEAEAFAMALRRRGHKAYVQKAHVKGRGLWFRVRIGPFKYRRSAEIYRQDFEAKERLVTFIVDPPKTTIIQIVPSAGEDPGAEP